MAIPTQVQVPETNTIPIGDYINTDAQSEVRNKNLQRMGGLITNDQPEKIPAKGLNGQQI